MFIMNSKTRSRKISLFKAYFKAILHYFGLLPLPGSTADGFGGWKRNHLSFVIHNSCLFLPSDS